MPRQKVKLNLKGLEEVATSPEMHRAIKALAEEVAGNVQNRRVGVHEGQQGQMDLPVEVYGPDNTTGMRWFNRAKAYVTLAHYAGLAIQAKHGALTKAASAAGLKVRGK